MSDLSLAKAIENLVSQPFDEQVKRYMRRNSGATEEDAIKAIEQRIASFDAGEVQNPVGDEDLLRLTAIVRVPGVVTVYEDETNS